MYLRLQNLMAEKRERRFFMMVMICYDQHDIRESALILLDLNHHQIRVLNLTDL